MPPVSDPVERNRAITALYARWYRAPGSWLKWCGMAVFASLTAGKLLAARGRGWFEKDIELFRQTNNRVFRDVGWAFYAWLHPDGGFDVVRAGLTDADAEQIAGWEAIERARRNDDIEAAWEGARHILRYEQRVHVQPGFEALHPLFRVPFSLFACTNYRDLVPDAPIRFYLLDRIRAGSLWPDIGRFEERFGWAAADALNLFRTLDETSTYMHSRMDALARMTG